MSERNYYNYQNTPEEDRFKTINEFKDCMVRGGEVEFVRNNKAYNITHYNGKIAISEGRKQETELLADTSDELLEYMIDDIRLRDIITEIEITDRTI